MLEKSSLKAGTQQRTKNLPQPRDLINFRAISSILSRESALFRQGPERAPVVGFDSVVGLVDETIDFLQQIALRSIQAPVRRKLGVPFRDGDLFRRQAFESGQVRRLKGNRDLRRNGLGLTRLGLRRRCGSRRPGAGRRGRGRPGVVGDCRSGRRRIRLRQYRRWNGLIRYLRIRWSRGSWNGGSGDRRRCRSDNVPAAPCQRRHSQEQNEQRVVGARLHFQSDL